MTEERPVHSIKISYVGPKPTNDDTRNEFNIELKSVNIDLIERQLDMAKTILNIQKSKQQ